MKSFVNAPSPLLAAVVRERNIKAACATIRNCEYHGAGAIDLHLSCLDDEYKNIESIKTILDAARIPVMALNYNHDFEYNTYPATEEERVGLLMMAVEAGVSCVDFQGYTYDLESAKGFRQEFSHLGYLFTKNNPREVVVDQKIIDKQMDLFERVHRAGTEVLLSTHTGVFMNTEEIVELALFLEKRKPDIIKIVTPCDNEEQLVESFKTMITLKKEVKVKTHYHCSGRCGSLSRIINPLLGGHLIFCVDRYGVNSHTEQLDLETAKAVVDGMKKFV